MLSTATRLRSHLLVLLFVEASVTLSSTEAFRPIHAGFFGGRRQTGSSSSSSKHQQKHNIMHLHTRVTHLTSSTNRSNTKLAESNANSEILDELKKVNKSITKMGDELKKVGDELAEVKTSNVQMNDNLEELNKSNDRIDNRTALTVAARYREKMDMERKEVKGVHDALSLLYIDTQEAEYDSAKTRLVSALYRRCTRDLFAKVTGTEWINEKEALASLKQWRRDPNKENNSNGGDTDDDYKSYSAHAETVVVVESFIKMLAPFDAVDVDKKQAHDAAQEILLHDETGLALSLIIATMDDKQVDKGGCWGWKVLEFDGFSHSDFSPHKINLLVVKCGKSSLQKAKKQLDVQTRFIDAVATPSIRG
jgi:hypothetical protein